MTLSSLIIKRTSYPAIMPNTQWCALSEVRLASVSDLFAARHQEGPPTAV